MKKNKSILLLLTTLIYLLLINAVYADSDLSNNKIISLNLLNQEPDPVEAGDIVELRINIQNHGGKPVVGDYIVEIEPKYPFKSVYGENLIKKVNLGGFSRNDRSQVIKFRLKVDSDAKSGTYSLPIIHYEDGKKSKVKHQEDLKIVITSRTSAEVISINTEKLVPGKKTLLEFGIKNVGKSPLRNAVFSWESNDDTILTVGSGNVRHIDEIKIGEEKLVSFWALTDVNAKPGLYKIVMTLRYDYQSRNYSNSSDTDNNDKDKEIITSKAGIYIGGGTEFDITFDKISSTGQYVFYLSNNGNSKASSLVVAIPEQENWQVNGKKSAVIGNLIEGDYGIVEFDLTKNSLDNLPITLEITYTGTDGSRESILKEVVINADNQAFDEMSFTYDSENNKNKSIPNAFYVIIVLGLVYLLYRWNKKKGKK